MSTAKENALGLIDETLSNQTRHFLHDNNPAELIDDIKQLLTTAAQHIAAAPEVSREEIAALAQRNARMLILTAYLSEIAGTFDTYDNIDVILNEDGSRE